MDKFGTVGELRLSKYVRDTLTDCMPGTYPVGSGNSIANYMPVENCLALLDEGLKWKGK